MTGRQVGLIFHGIGAPGRTLEPGEAPYWVSERQFDQVLDRVQALQGRVRVRLSFDDGNLSDHAIALPRLRARGMVADFFVLTGRLDQPGSLGAGHLRDLLAAGMTVGSHGIAHRDWARLDPAALHEELHGSRRRLEEICARPVTSAAIPFGAYSGRVLRALAGAGYRQVFTSDGGTMDPAAFLCPRSSVRGGMSADDVEAILLQRASPLRRLRRLLGMARRRL